MKRRKSTARYILHRWYLRASHKGTVYTCHPRTAADADRLERSLKRKGYQIEAKEKQKNWILQ